MESGQRLRPIATRAGAHAVFVRALRDKFKCASMDDGDVEDGDVEDDLEWE